MATSIADPTEIAKLLPTFWTDVFGDRPTVAALLRGVATAGEQTVDAIDDLLSSVSPVSIEPTRRTRWLRWSVTSADRRPAPPPEYGAGYVFGPQPVTGQVVEFGRSVDSTVSYPLPAGVVSAATVADNLALPSAVYTVGVECFIQSGRMVFLTDPLSPGAGATTLWLADARVDASDLTRRFGGILGTRVPSTVSGRALVDAGTAAAATGADDLTTRQILAALTGLPCVASTETVEAVLSTVYATRVVTDKAVYTYPPTVTPTVVVGDSLVPGQWPIAEIGVYRATELPATVTDVPLPAAMTGLAGALTIPNRRVAATTVVDSGHLTTTWEMGGDAAVVTAFFAAARAAGLAADKTIGDSLDPRPDTSVPLATAVPAEINPFAVMAGQGLLDCVRYVTLAAGVCNPSTVAGQLVRLSPLLPPHVTLQLISV